MEGMSKVVEEPPLQQLRGSLFARSLRCKLNRLDARRFSHEDHEPAGLTQSECQCGACNTATVLSSSLTEKPPITDVNFLLGRFLSGSDPALARSHFEDDGGPEEGFVDDTASPLASDAEDQDEDSVLVNEFVMDAEEEVNAEDESESPKSSRNGGSLSSGFGSEVDVQRMNEEEDETPPLQTQMDGLVLDADFLLNGGGANWMNGCGRSLGSACSLTTDEEASSGISTPLQPQHSSPHECLPLEEETERRCGRVVIESPEPPVNFLTFKTGAETHKVATAKLNNLLSLLENSQKQQRATSPRPHRCDSAPSLVAKDDRRALSGGQNSSSLVEIRVTEAPPKRDVEDEVATAARLQEELKETLAEPEKPRRLKKASSLKTGKTPPNTPGKSKIVR